jgi:acetyl/propionyl-CoA carboxylase alpha subunit
VDIHKVNSTLGKALNHIREGEIEDLNIALSEDENDGDIVSEYFEGLVDQVCESGADRETAFDVVMGAASDLAEKAPATVQTEADIDAWAEHVGLADEIVARLN